MARKALVFGLSLILTIQPLFAQETRGEPQASQGEPYKVQVQVPMTVVDLVFTNKRGDVLGLDLKDTNINEALEVFEDGKPQKIEFFEPSEAPLTTVLLVESTPLVGYIRYQNLQAAYIFLQELQEKDWVALVSYDMKPRLEVDFTHNKDEIYQALVAMQYGGFSEANIYDAIIDTLERLKDVKGKTSIIVIGTGLDTMSKYTWDDIGKAARNHRTTIFCVGMSWLLELYYDRLEAYGYRVAPARMEIIAARSRMEDMARATGGAAYFPRFESALPDIYKTVAGYLRIQHTIGYYPTNRNFDGKKRRIEVRLKSEFEAAVKRNSDINGDGKVDKKDLKEKIIIHHRTEYYPGRVE